MKSYELSILLSRTTGLLSPVGYSVFGSNRAYYVATMTKENWEAAYTEKENLLSNLVRDFKTSLKGLQYKTEEYQPLVAFFKEVTPAFLVQLEAYRYRTVSPQVFLNRTRLRSLCTTDQQLGLMVYLCDYLYISRPEKLVLAKEQMKKIWLFFVEALEAIVESFDKVIKQEKELLALGLPLDTKELLQLYQTTTELGELFSWAASSRGFYYWAKVFLDYDEQTFKRKVEEYLNWLDPTFPVKEYEPKRSQKSYAVEYKEPGAAPAW